jgi:DNA-binding transcriptional ArsR family regulator
MPSKERRHISDPKELRALAHPLRMKLMQIIAREGKATATDCAREVGESVANCSYHLNILAKYEFIELAEGGQGREKPWQVVYQGHSWDNVAADDESTLAAEAASEAFMDFAFAEIRDRLRRLTLEPEDWRNAIGIDDSNEFLTAEEAEAVRAEFRALLDKYRSRRSDRSARPPGARPVHFFLSTTVKPD